MARKIVRDKLILSIGTIGLVFSLLGAVFVPPQPTLALSGVIDPNGDGSVIGYAPTGSASHFETINDNTRQPTVPNTADYISVSANTTNSDFFTMTSISGLQSVSVITIWAYHNDGNDKGRLHANLYASDESTTYGTEAQFANQTVNGWDSLTFSSLSLNQSQLDDLRIRIRFDRSSGQPPTGTVYALYADVTYASIPSIVLTTDGAVDFGQLAPSATQDTTASGTNDVQTIFIEGGPVDLDIRSTVFSDGSNTWTLGTAAGADQVKWEFSPDGNTWTTFSASDTLFSLASNLPVDANQNFYLRLTTPSSSSSFNQHNTTVTIVLSTP